MTWTVIVNPVAGRTGGTWVLPIPVSVIAEPAGICVAWPAYGPEVGGMFTVTVDGAPSLA